MDKIYVNNHIHTEYSFSPYTPSQAVIRAKESGLVTAGLMDHDTIAGAEEFLAEGKRQNFAVTVGMETRVSLKGTSFENVRLNNPDQKGIAYVAIHGVPHKEIKYLNEVFAPYRAFRNERNRLMSAKIADIIRPYGMTFDFDTDVVPRSAYNKGGTITERTLCYVLALKIAERYGKSGKTVKFLKEELSLDVSQKAEGYLTDPDNPHYIYDLLGVLKGGLVDRFYINADKECMPVKDYIRLCAKIGAISAYAYLGDVGNSVTGDKKAQTFEDGYLDDLFAFLKRKGFNAVTYMPSRNTLEQLVRVQSLCRKLGFFEISGEDINSSRQSFICETLTKPEFSHLITATYALIGHERQANIDLCKGMFSKQTKARVPDLNARIEIFSKAGR